MLCNSSHPISREYIRIKVRGDVAMRIAVSSVFGENVQSGYTPVLLDDLSPGGLKFQTHLRFPVSKDYSLQAWISFGDWDFCLTGSLQWRRREENRYVYGMAFVPNNKMNLALKDALLAYFRLKYPNRQKVYLLYQRMMEEEVSSTKSGFNHWI
ncbi:PilZ domain-containing protein [Paenibacillus sp. GCM10023250]|uniref:PilZ domain-containing protein n=1 Tax=Paenibacillus sp. GCM10023250 TaxID=3252648 RepID=UPI003620B9EB